MSAWNSVRTVELVQAFLWTCEDCGRDNFERAVTIDPESMEGKEVEEFARQVSSEVNESAEALGIEVGGDWLASPSCVKCKFCGSEFSTVEPD